MNTGISNASAVPMVDFSLFEATPGMRLVFLPDAPKFTIIAATKDICRHFDLLREKVVGKGVFEAFPSNPDDLTNTGEARMRASLEHVLQQKEPHQLPIQRYDIKEANGCFTNKYWKISNLPVLNSAGEVSSIIHTTEDITDLVMVKEKEVKLKDVEQAYNLLLQAPVAIAIFKGAENRVELANASALKVWNKGTEVIGRPLLEVYPEIQGQGIVELLDEVRNTGKPYQAAEVPAIVSTAATNEIRYFDVVYQPYYDADNDKAAGVFTLSHDVTELVLARRKIEEAKKEAETQKRLYETINGSTPDLIYVFDLNYRFTYVNKALLTMWGKTWEQSIGRGLLENGYEPWHAEMHEREIDQVVATKKPVRGEVSFPHATLGKREYDYIFVPVINEKGEVEAVAGTTRDITEQRKAKQNIRESEERFRNLADDSPMFVFIIDPDAAAPVNYWNKTWLQYTGQTLEEAKGRAWDGIIHPDDVPAVMDKYTPAFQNQQPYLIPAVRVKRFDGIYRWHAFKGNPRYLPNGDFNGYVGVGFDIHEQKLSEEIIKQSEAQLQLKVAERTAELESQKNLLNNILTNSSNGISVSKMIRDSKGRVIDTLTILANEAAVRYTGLPKEIYLTKTATAIDPDMLTSPYGKTCLQTLETGEPALVQYFLEVTQRWLELTISKMDEDHLIHIFTDVTHIKEAQIQLERTVEELKRSNQNLEEFAYAASHDLKEPIRKIHIFSDRLKGRLQDKLAEEDKIYFDRMEKAAQRMSALIEDLLLYSHVSRGAILEEMVDLNQKVKNVMEDLDLELEQKNANVVVGTLPTIKGHRRQLQQLFQNLISNAIKYNRPGIPPQVHISSRIVDGLELGFHKPIENTSRQYHFIEVRDNGIGFEPDDAERIFNVFTRLHGNTEYKGTGVGLSIARKVVANHGGTIWAESQKGEGATFKIILPAEV